MPGGTFADEPGDTTWAASAVSHGNVVQSGDPRRVTKTGSAQTSDPANDPDEDDPADDSDTDPAQADQQD